MTKAEMVAQIAEQAGIKKVEAEKALNAMVEIVVNEVKAGSRLTISGLGTFTQSQLQARKGRNPQTGAEIDIPARKAMKFKASKTVADLLN